MESYIEFALEALSLAYAGFIWESRLDKFSSIFAIVTLIVVTFVPITLTLYLRKNWREFRFSDFRKRFNSVIGDFNFRYKSGADYISIFCYRRLI